MVVPDPFEELLGADHYAVGGTEHLEDSELLHAQPDGMAAPAHQMSSPIKHKIPPDNDRCRRRGPPTEGTNPGQELGEGEGFGQIVVRPEREPGYLVVDGSGGRQHDDASLGGSGYQHRADSVSMHHGQVPVQDDHVVGSESRQLDCTSPIYRDVHGDAGIV